MRALHRAREGIRGHARMGIADIQPVSVPGEVRVGEERTVRVALSSTGIVQPFDPDFCFAQNVQAGLSVEAQARVNGDLVTDQFCLPAAAASIGNTREFAFQVFGNEPGTLDVEIEVIGQDSGNLLAQDGFTVAVVEGGDGSGGARDDEPDDEDGGEGPGGFLPCWADPNRKCERTETIAWTLGAVGVAAVVLSN